MKVLVVVDVQNDFMPGGSLGVPKGNEIVPVINAIQDSFDLIIATQDWHPQDHVSFAANHEGKKEFDVIDVHGFPQTLWPAHCVQGTEGASFHPDLKTHRIETIFRKGTDKNIDSYSSFFDNSKLKSTGLTGYLLEKGATEIYFCGLAADICVYFSTKDSLSEGFQSYLITDASRPLDENIYKIQKQELRELGAQIISSDEILQKK